MNLFKNKKKYKHSFSQSGEDLIVNFIFNHILNIEKFSYFDIGANHPFELSNTALFYELGMNGLLIEPDFLLYQDLIKERKRDKILNIGVTSNDTNHNEMDFYKFNIHTLSTFNKYEAIRLSKMNNYKIVEVIKIKVKNLNILFNEYFVPDFLSLDIEGYDFEVVKSIDFNLFRPKVMCIETSIHGGDKMGLKDFEMIEFITKKDYLHYGDTFNNSIFLDCKLIN